MKRPELFLIVLALVLSGCASSGGPRYSANQLQVMGEKYLAAGDTANALRFLTEAEKKRPDDASLQYALGLAYNQRNLPDQAVDHLQKALAVRPDYPEALNALGTVYAERGQVDKARDAFQKVLANPFYQTPQFAAYNLGRLYEKQGDLETALTQYEQAVKFQPSYGSAWYRIGKILETQRRNDEARNAYGKAASFSPEMAEAHLRYGQMSYQAGDFDAANLSLNRVLKLAPNTALADEAKLYLERLRDAPVPRSDSGASRSRSSTSFEVLSGQDTPRKPPEPVQPPAAPQSPPAPQQATSSVSGDAPATGQGGQLLILPEFQPFNYIVQLGSFVDKDKAEEMKNFLHEKGYSPVVKSLKKKDLGRVYVIQLKPVATYSRASTLMTQLESEVPGEPVILKVPVEISPVASPPVEE